MKSFFKVISFVFQPLLMPVYGIVIFLFTDLAAFYHPVWKWIALSGTLVFTALLPSVPILMMMRKGQINDLFISKREQRTLPYLFALLSYIFWTLFLWKILQLPLFFVAMGLGSVLSIIMITLVNVKWKISAHLSGVGGLTGGVFAYSYVMGINPLWFMVTLLAVSCLTAMSRIELKAHTPWQTLAGFATGFLMVFIPGVLTGGR